MRQDEQGNPCPGTLGEYYDLCLAIGGVNCPAVKLLQEKIDRYGRDEEVVAEDSQMRALLMPLLVSDAPVNTDELLSQWAKLERASRG